MKILIVQKVIGLAGSENYIINTLNELKTRGIDVKFLLIYNTNDTKTLYLFEDKLIQTGVKYFKLPSKKYPDLKLLFAINKLIKEEKIELVQTNLLYSDITFSLLKLLFRPKIKIVRYIHGYDDNYTTKYGFTPVKNHFDPFYLSFKFANFFTDYTVTVTKGLFELCSGLGVLNKDKSQIIHHGFHFNENLSSTENMRFGSPQLIIVGRFVNFKGHIMAIEALSLLKVKYPEIKLVLVGWGEEEQNIRKKISEKNVEKNVIFTGRQFNAREYIASSDIFLLPSYSEGFGIVLLEAMSVKTPIVAFNVYSPKELLKENEEILLAKPYDIEDFANKIEFLIENESERKRISDNAYRKFKTYYTIERMIDETIDVYKKVLKIQS